jgi:signal transduction histidine kinase
MFNLEGDERRHFARELYDTIAQNLAVLIIDVGLIIDRLGLPSEARAGLSECLSLARQNLDEIVI